MKRFCFGKTSNKQGGFFQNKKCRNIRVVAFIEIVAIVLQTVEDKFVETPYREKNVDEAAFPEVTSWITVSEMKQFVRV